MDGPDIRRLYYSATEVCEDAGITRELLKHWEIVFPSVKPVKSRSGRRLFKPHDLEIIQKIKEMKDAGFKDDKIRSYLKTIQNEHHFQTQDESELPAEGQQKLVHEIESILNEIVDIINA